MKKLVVFMILAFSCSLLADSIPDVVKQEVEDELSSGAKSNLSIQLRIDKYMLLDQTDETPAPVPTQKDKDIGFILFKRDFMKPIYYNTKPKQDEINPGSVDAFASLGEYEPATFGIYPLESGQLTVILSDLVNESGDKIGKDNVDIRAVKHLVKSVDLGQAKIMPEMLLKESPVRIYNGVTKQIWMQVFVPEKSKPGKYKAEIKVKLNKKEEASLELRVNVLPFKLLDPDAGFGWFGSPDDELGLKDYKKHRNNMTCVANGLDVKITSVSGEKAKLDFSGANKSIELYKKYGLAEHDFLISMMIMANDLISKFSLPEFSPSFRAVYKDIMKQCQAWADSKKIKVAYMLVDEPREDQLSIWNRNLADTIKYDKLAREVPGARNMVDPMGDSYYAKDYLPLVDDLDIIMTHCSDVCKKMMRKTLDQKKELWIYNSDRTRSGFGFIVWKNRIKVRLEWAYAWGWSENNSKDIGTWSTYVSKDPSTGIVYYGKDEIISTPIYEWCSEGIDDYMYAYTLSKTIESANALSDPEAKKAAKKSQAVLDSITERVPEIMQSQNKDDAAKIRQTDFDAQGYRKQIADEIVKLKQFVK